MSILSKQVKELRILAIKIKKYGATEELKSYKVISEAADTIEALSAKLAAANMERSDRYYGGGWIVASERMPKEERCIDPETGYYGRSDYVLCSAYDDYEMKDEIWVDYTIDGEWQTHEWYEGEKLAWQSLPEPYRP